MTRGMDAFIASGLLGHLPVDMAVELTTQMPDNVTDGGDDDDMPEWKQSLQQAYEILIVVILQLIMLGMGANITIQQIWKHLRRPWGIIIGLTCQFILMPLAMFGMAHALSLADANAIGLMMISCCPGGGMSNLFSYMINGDVPLSISMTALSTFLALGMMPLNLFLYTRSWTGEEDSVVVPFASIAISLVLIIVVVSIGMLIHWKWPRAAAVLVKVGVVAGALFILVAVGMQAIIQTSNYINSGWTVWFSAIVGPTIGYGIGFTLATIARMDWTLRKTVAFETSIQNMALASTLITLSFPEDFASDAIVLPTLFGFCQIAGGFAVSLVYRLYRRRQEKNRSTEDEEKDTKVTNNNNNEDEEKQPDQWNSAFIVLEKF